MMGVVRFVSALALVTLAAASIADNSLDGGERVVQVAPVLAPPRDSRTHDMTRSRQFPILVLLALRDPPVNSREHEAKSLEGDRPIYYVQKLEDPKAPDSNGRSRQKRSPTHKHKSQKQNNFFPIFPSSGGYKHNGYNGQQGHYSGGGGGGGGGGRFGGGGGGGGGGGYGGGGGGGGGGYGK